MGTGSLLDNNKSILQRCDKRSWKLTLTPAVTCVASLAGMDGLRSAVPVMSVDVKVVGPGLRIELGDEFLDLKNFLNLFISLMVVKVKEKDLSIT